ncbi:MAG: DUF4328 domain-containing protein [Erythrobacter sp.]
MDASNLRVPALLVTIFAWVVLAATLVGSLALAIWLVSYSQMSETPIMLLVSGIAGLIGYLAFVPSVVIVMIWVYRAHSNLHRAGLSGLNYTPSWATFSFLVPVMNLFVPFRAMRELANRSAGEPEELAEADNQDVFAWWGCWIGLFVINLFLLYTAVIEILPWIWLTTPFWATQVLSILASMLTAGAAFYLIQIVKQVTRDQQDGASVVAAFE